MRTIEKLLEDLLFETEAIRVAPEDRPYWYAAGTIGPFYCNTHYLFGGEAAAGELLAQIDALLAREVRRQLPQAVAAMAARQYSSGGAYREAIDAMAGYLAANVDMDDIGAISGGERRDWFFSFAAAAHFGKAHLAVFKDQEILVSYPEAFVRAASAESAFPASGAESAAASGAESAAADSDHAASAPVALAASNPAAIEGKCVLHVCDLVTEASSFKRSWEPALRRLGLRISESLAIVDRLQGGGETLASLGIKHHALAAIDAGLFDRALAAGRINQRQHGQVLRYIADPRGTMRAFLAERPRFVSDAIASGGKDAERARLCLESGVYTDTQVGRPDM